MDFTLPGIHISIPSARCRLIAFTLQINSFCFNVSTARPEEVTLFKPLSEFIQELF
jgi:hypothetical protein